MRLSWIVPLSLFLSPGPAAALPFARLIERPVVRFLLTETVEGRSIVEWVMGRWPTQRVPPGDLRAFADTLEHSREWRPFARELRARMSTIDGELAAHRTAGDPAIDVTARLRTFAARELRVRWTDPELRTGLAFRRDADDLVYGAARDRFLDGASGPVTADVELAERLESISESLAWLETGRVEPDWLLGTLVYELRGFRGAALEVAVQSRANPAAYSPHREVIRSLRIRFIREINRLAPEMTAGRLRELRAEARETRRWVELGSR